MKITAQIADRALLGLIGQRLAQLRLSQNLTQRHLAEQAGLAQSTVQRLESGAAATQLSGFIRVCRALGLIERFETLIPEIEVSPITQLKLRGRKRQRARGAVRAAVKEKKWTWGEDS